MSESRKVLGYIKAKTKADDLEARAAKVEARSAKLTEKAATLRIKADAAKNDATVRYGKLNGGQIAQAERFLKGATDATDNT